MGRFEFIVMLLLAIFLVGGILMLLEEKWELERKNRDLKIQVRMYKFLTENLEKKEMNKDYEYYLCEESGYIPNKRKLNYRELDELHAKQKENDYETLRNRQDSRKPC